MHQRAEKAEMVHEELKIPMDSRVQRSLGALETRNLDLLDQTQHSLTYLTHESC